MYVLPSTMDDGEQSTAPPRPSVSVRASASERQRPSPSPRSVHRGIHRVRRRIPTIQHDVPSLASQLVPLDVRRLRPQMLEEILVRRHRSPVRGTTLGVKRREHATGRTVYPDVSRRRRLATWRRRGASRAPRTNAEPPPKPPTSPRTIPHRDTPPEGAGWDPPPWHHHRHLPSLRL